MRAEIGRIPGTEQASAEYGKKVNAKATVSEAQAIAELASAGPLMVARFAVLVAFVSLAVSLVAFWIVMARR